MPTSTPTPFDRLSQWLAEGNLTAAEAFWRKREDGGKLPARFVELGAKVAEQDGRWEDALARWQRCGEIDPDRRSVVVGQVRALLQLQRWMQARDLLDNVLAQDPDRLIAHEMAARVAMHLGQHDVAQTHWRRAAEDPRFARQASLALMEIHEQAGNMELAAQQALMQLEAPRLPMPVLKSMLRLMRGTGRWAAAVSLLERLVKLEPTNQRHRLALAQSQIALRQFEQARAGLDRADRLPPGLPAWQAASEVVRGQADEAFLMPYATRALLPAGLPLGGEALPSVQQLSVLLELAADARVATLTRLLAQARDQQAALVLQRMVQLALAGAQQQPLVAVQHSDLAPAAHAVLGLLLARLQQQAGEFQAALSTLDALDMEPLNEAWGGDAVQRQILTLRHACWLRLGDLAAAKLALDQGLAAGLDRDWAAARALDLALNGLGQAEAAVKWTGATPLQDWRRPFARQDHALALGGSGRATRAVAQLQARLDSRPEDDDARLALAGVLQLASDPALALASLNPLWQRDGLRPLAYKEGRQTLLPATVCAVGTAASVKEGHLVSIVVTVSIDHAHLLPSLRSMLAQSWAALELMVVTTGLPDDAMDSLVHSLGQDTRFRVLALPAGTGVARARNLAWQQAHGDFVWFSDADAWWHPDALATQMAALAAQPQWLACRHTTLRVDASGRLLYRPERPLQPGGVSALLMRRELMDRLGGFDEVPRGYNAEWMQRLVRTLGLSRLGDVAAPLRLTTLHEGSQASGADLPAHWFGQDPVVDQYLHAARRWLNDAAARTPVMDTAQAGRPFPIPQDL